MRRVLIASTYFAEEVYLGTLRITALARYLGAHGWEPTFLTPRVPGPLAVDDPAVPVIQYPDIKSPYASVKRAAGGSERLTLEEAQPDPSPIHAVAAATLRTVRGSFIPDPSIVWWPFAVRAGLSAARRRPFDAILTTSNPPTPHLIGSSLKRRLNVPWVADFRDLWTLNHYRKVGPVRQRLEEMMERRTLRGADTLVTISDEYVERLRVFLGPSAPPIETIPLGVDPAVLPIGKTPPTDAFTLTYTGTFIEGRRDPDLLFTGVRAALDRGWIDPARLRIRFYGPSFPFIDESAARYGLSEVVTQLGYVSRDEALLRQRESQIVLLFLWDHPAEAGAFSGKLEFLFSGRPVLVTGGPATGIWCRLIERSGAGAYATDGETVACYLRDAYAAYLMNGTVPTRASDDALDELLYPAIVARFAELLDRLVAR